MEKTLVNEIKAIIANFDESAVKDSPELSEELTRLIGLNLEDDEVEDEDNAVFGGVLYYFDENKNLFLIVDTYENYPPTYTVDEFIKTYGE